MEAVEKDETRKGVRIGEAKLEKFKRIRAAVCHHCPLCIHARKNPGSMIGKILHHKYHADNCPMWKAEKEVYGQNKTMNPSEVEVRTHMLWKAF